MEAGGVEVIPVPVPTRSRELDLISVRALVSTDEGLRLDARHFESSYTWSDLLCVDLRILGNVGPSTEVVSEWQETMKRRRKKSVDTSQSERERLLAEVQPLLAEAPFADVRNGLEEVELDNPKLHLFHGYPGGQR